VRRLADAGAAYFNLHAPPFASREIFSWRMLAHRK
jgi:hypothetical protein